ncbi:HNH endonuclease [Natronosalvus caseinilyticus]|uniref:HNH endonuclease n=1 Tax=Natronosalvus caseinilyticus TaxID=2953747 RepID=UPI003CCCC8F3
MIPIDTHLAQSCISIQEIRDRDGDQCVLCLNSDKIHVHHIDGEATNNDSDNLVTLCERCHNRIHSIQNRHSNRTKGDFIGELVDEGHKRNVVLAVLREVTM